MPETLARACQVASSYIVLSKQPLSTTTHEDQTQPGPRSTIPYDLRDYPLVHSGVGTSLMGLH
eukprot:11561574-Alexandrium_andersonii.AAC.1